MAFQAFYDRCRAGQQPGYPRFKPRSRFDQVMFVNGDGAKWRPATGNGWARASFQAVGAVKVRQHRAVRGTLKTLQLKREHRRDVNAARNVYARAGLGSGQASQAA